MSEATVNWENHRYLLRERKVTASATARADRILALAERREAPAPSASRVLESATMDKMDKLALVVAAIMTIGPLFAAYVGSMLHA